VIVVDTNVLAYYWIKGPFTEAAERLEEADPVWVAPAVWRHELWNVLATLVKARQMSLELAGEVAARAELQMDGSEMPVEAKDVLSLAARSGCSAYDGEFVALAISLGVPLVTCDRKLVKAFPRVARLLAEAVEADS
jgi:predicted nucleic acid-binding protein